ncbi:STAS domain-containing protein [Kitasatospora purpeofusca]|uniref:STAS domain-containing protein n=1 Tax=Kitasatospora purpeofusca TaxID=67352 RepID=UPI0036CC80BF
MSATPGALPEPGGRPREPLGIASHRAVTTTVVCRVTGGVDHEHRRLLDETLAKAITDAPALLVVDLAALTFCDSTCLNALLRARNDAEAAGVWMVLSGVGPQLLRLLEITGTVELFTRRAHLRTAATSEPD